ncbi:MAG: GNAT family N-acetyltransferase [Parachlamydiales bacterium]|nr:GNAT family N-acetyltransferase [Parachlamydiales bacterium]
MIPIPGFDIRYSTMEDLPYLQEWFQGDAACNDFPFGPKEKDDALKNWIGFSKFKASLTGLIDNVPCAIGTLFLMPYRKVAHHCSFYLIVDPKHRKKGIGTSMVRNLLNLAKTRFRLEAVHVEVYEPAPIVPVLVKTGFEEIVRQENFVKTNGVSRARLIWEHALK